jgi:hypothetical protein
LGILSGNYKWRKRERERERKREIVNSFDELKYDYRKISKMKLLE